MWIGLTRNRMSCIVYFIVMFCVFHSHVLCWQVIRGWGFSDYYGAEETITRQGHEVNRYTSGSIVICSPTRTITGSNEQDEGKQSGVGNIGVLTWVMNKDS